jgi:hypothetical protein
MRVTEYSPLESGEFGRKPKLLVLAATFFRLNTDGTQSDLLSSSPLDKTWRVEVQGKTRFVEGRTRDFVAIRTDCKRLEIETTRSIPRCLE